MESYQRGSIRIEDAKTSQSPGEEEANQTENEISNEYVLNVAFFSFVGFMALESVYAVIAGSASMLEDAEAMSVDALTYLFNLWAERIKHRPYSAEELRMRPELRDYKREMTRLYLEVVPPLISVTTLIVVTLLATDQAVKTLRQTEEDQDVDVSLMLLFSALNLILDIVNVACFARAKQAFGLSVVKKEPPATMYNESLRNIHRANENSMEMEPMVLQSGEDSQINYLNQSPETETEDFDRSLLVNLNMCSAWTHICADTLRSITVLIAATVAACFDNVSGTLADSLAAIVVSVIIMISLIPLLRGLYITARQIIVLSTDPNRPQM
jgi:Co/Zn/Cd efflux system component